MTAGLPCHKWHLGESRLVVIIGLAVRVTAVVHAEVSHTHVALPCATSHASAHLKAIKH